ncbi:MAG: hypothetical protein WCH44_19205, partial [Betaproteobacteria bacterium]
NVAQDWQTQWLTSVSMAAVGYLMGAALIGLLSMRLWDRQRPGNKSIAGDMLHGLGLVVLLKGVGAALQHLIPENNPGLPGVGAWDSQSPLLSTVLLAAGGVPALIAGLALVLTAAHFCSSRQRTAWLGALVVLLAVASALASETYGGGLVAVATPLLLGLTLWALARRGEVGVAISLLALSPLANLAQMLAAPVANAASMAAVSGVVAVVLTWWALRYGRSLGRERP